MKREQKVLYLVNHLDGSVLTIHKGIFYKNFIKVDDQKWDINMLNKRSTRGKSFFDNKEEAESFSNFLKELIDKRELFIRANLIINSSVIRKADLKAIESQLRKYPRQFYFNTKDSSKSCRFIGFNSPFSMIVSYDDKRPEILTTLEDLSKESNFVFRSEEDKNEMQYWQELEYIYLHGKKGFRKMNCKNCTVSFYCKKFEDSEKQTASLFNGEDHCKDFLLREVLNA